jgi:phosphatidylethanolamine-binding protein (PEBP) family uncharacterized protein
VTWPSNKTARLGNAIAPKDASDVPEVQLLDGTSKTESTAYAVAMTDPDAPSRDDPKWSEFCHWILDKSGSTKSILDYRPPTPPAKTGYHRYVLVAFEPQNGTHEKLHLSKPEDRKRWGTGKKRHGVRDWAKENGLAPIAANFIYVQNEKQS